MEKTEQMNYSRRTWKSYWLEFFGTDDKPELTYSQSTNTSTPTAGQIVVKLHKASDKQNILKANRKAQTFETTFSILNCKTSDHNSTKGHKVLTDHKIITFYLECVTQLKFYHHKLVLHVDLNIGVYIPYSRVRAKQKCQNVYLQSLIERPSKGCKYIMKKKMEFRRVGGNLFQ